MELIPIIENSLLIFIGILIIVVLFSYVSFKFGNKSAGKKSELTSNQPAYKNIYINNIPSDNYIEGFPQKNSVNSDNLFPGIPHSYFPPKALPLKRENKLISKRFIVVNDLAQETSFSALQRRA